MQRSRPTVELCATAAARHMHPAAVQGSKRCRNVDFLFGIAASAVNATAAHGLKVG